MAEFVDNNKNSQDTAEMNAYRPTLNVLNDQDFSQFREENNWFQMVTVQISDKYCPCLEVSSNQWVTSATHYFMVLAKSKKAKVRFRQLQVNFWRYNHGQNKQPPQSFMEQLDSEAAISEFGHEYEQTIGIRDWEKDECPCVADNVPMCLLMDEEYEKYLAYLKDENNDVQFLTVKHKVRLRFDSRTRFTSTVDGFIKRYEYRVYVKASSFVDNYGEHEQPCAILAARVKKSNKGYWLDVQNKRTQILKFYNYYFLLKDGTQFRKSGKNHSLAIALAEYNACDICKKVHLAPLTILRYGELMVLSEPNYKMYKNDNPLCAQCTIQITDALCKCISVGPNKWITSSVDYFTTISRSKKRPDTTKISFRKYIKTENGSCQWLPIDTIKATSIFGREFEKSKELFGWAMSEPFTVPDDISICVLEQESYQKYFEYMMRQQMVNKAFVHYATHRLCCKDNNGHIATGMIQGFIVRYEYRFYTSTQAFMDLYGRTPQKCKIMIAFTHLHPDGSVKLQVKSDMDQILKFYDLYHYKKSGKHYEQLRDWYRDALVASEIVYDMYDGGSGIDIDLTSCPPPTGIIYLYSKKCHCSDCNKKGYSGQIVDRTALVETNVGINVPVSVHQCLHCGRVYMNYQVYKSYNKKYGGLKFHCKVNTVSLSNKPEEGLDFAKDSFLSRNGYSVKESVPSASRRTVLARILDEHIATKQEIIEKITEFINLRRNDHSMAGAIVRWEEDISFVADYRTGSQNDIGEHEICQAGRITEPFSK